MRTGTVGSIVLCLLVVSSGLWTSNLATAARQRPILIGALTDSWGPTPHIVGLQDGLVEQGYKEHEDFEIGVRFTQGDHTALPAAARELVQYGVDIIFATSAEPTHAAQQATRQIPIVFASVEDPVGLGLVRSFARPGANVTGVTGLSLELGPKRLEVFRALIPRLKKVLFPYNASHAPSVAMAQVYRDAARRLGIVLLEKAVRTEAEARAVLADARKSGVDGILHPPSVSLNIPGLILKAASEQAIPAMFQGAFWTERGALASYGPSAYESGRQAARLVDKIIKGAKPAEIPVETNSKIEFTINLKTADSLRIEIPPEVLYRADRVIR